MVGLKGLAAQLFAKQSLAKEFDPESELPVDDDSDNQNDDAGSDSEVSAPEDTQDTEHYVQVGKSKLRRNEPVALGPAYRGVRVSRKQLEKDGGDDDEDEEDNEDEDEDDEDEEFDDPDEVDIEGAEDVNTDDEIDSDEAFGEDDDDIIKKFTFRGSAKPKTPKGKPVYSDGEDDDEEDDGEDEEDSEGGEIEDLASSGDDDEEDGEDDEDEDDEGDDEDEEEEDDELDASAAKAEEETRKILAQERRQVLSSISASAKADADKGFAVRQQRRTFDALLNMRIRMQKALSTANTLHTVAKEDATTAATDSAVEEAAAKAIELLISIQDIRKAFYDADNKLNTKRKRRSGGAGGIGPDSSCQAIFDEMTVAEEAASAKRRKVIDRWAARVQRPSAASAAAASRRFTAAAASQPLTTVLDGQLVTPERLVRRTRTPRSCAPVQAAKKVEEDPEIYDDADFYQLLLKELVDQRTVDGTAPGSTAPTVRWAATAAKDAKTRKLVDRKASKGRKMRYNVHAKLQNFAAPEDRRDWEPEAIDRFFSSLFGQRMALQEDDGEDEDDDADEDTEMGGASVGGEGLRLF